MSKKNNPVLQFLPEDWQEAVLSLYKEGASDTEVRADLGLSYAAWRRCMDESVDFFNTVVLGRQFSKAWWLKQGRSNLLVREFNAYLWYKNMQNRFAWSEKQQTNVDGPSADEEEGYDDDAADEELDRLLRKTRSGTASH